MGLDNKNEGDDEFKKYLNESERYILSKEAFELETLRVKSEYLIKLVSLVGNLNLSEDSEKKLMERMDSLLEHCEQTVLQFDYLIMNVEDSEEDPEEENKD